MWNHFQLEISYEYYSNLQHLRIYEYLNLKNDLMTSLLY